MSGEGTVEDAGLLSLLAYSKKEETEEKKIQHKI